MPSKALRRSVEHRMIAGVCGGIAEWQGWPPQNVRLVYVLLSVLTAFAGIPVYVLLWLLVPEASRAAPTVDEAPKSTEPPSKPRTARKESEDMPLYRSREHKILGGVCGGIAQWLGWGPWKVRILYVILGALPVFAGIPIYVVLWLIVPLEPRRGRHDVRGVA